MYSTLSNLCCALTGNIIFVAVGIDLGTTFSVVGVNKNGKVIIIEDKAGHKIFPSIVSYLDNGGSTL